MYVFFFMQSEQQFLGVKHVSLIYTITKDNARALIGK